MGRLPHPDKSWDLVTCIHSLEHCPEPQRAVAEVARVLRPAGWLFLVAPREGAPSRDPLHNYAFPNAESLRQLVLAEGSLDAATIREDLGILAKGCRELRLLVRKRNSVH